MVIVAALGVAIACDLARRGLARDVIPDLADPADRAGRRLDGPPGAGGRRRGDAAADRGAGGRARGQGDPRLDDDRDGVRRRRVRVGVGAGRRAPARSRRASSGARAELPPNVRVYRRAGGVDHRLGVRVRADRSGARVVAAGDAAVPGGRAPPGARRDPGRRRGGVRRRRPARRCAIDVKPRELRERGLAFTDVRRGVAAGVRAAPARRPSGVARVSLAPICEALPIGAPRRRRRRRRRVRCATSRWCARPRTCRPGSPTSAGVRAVGGIVIAQARRRHRGARRRGQARRSRARRASCRTAPPIRSGSIRARPPTCTSRPPTTARTWRRACARTLLRALGEEVGVVVLVILMFLLHARSALVPLATLPVVAAADVRRDVAARACRRRS